MKIKLNDFKVKIWYNVKKREKGCDEMLEMKKMERLSGLAKKKKMGTITEAEIQEQALLRKEYLEVFRMGMKETIENTKVVDPEGNDVTPEKIKAICADKVVRPTS